MKGIILAGRGKPHIKIKGESPKSTLSWILPSLKESKIKEVTVVAGEEIDFYRKKYADLDVKYNKDWSRSGMLNTLAQAEDEIKKSFLVSYSDIIFKPELVKKLIKKQKKSKSNFIIALDLSWRERFHNRNIESCLKAEKVLVKENDVEKISKTEVDFREADGEFAGLMLCNDEGAKIISKLFKRYMDSSEMFTEENYFRNAHLIDLIQKLISGGHQIDYVDVSGEWAELDDQKDIYTFIFQNKANTLKSLEGKFEKSRVLPQISFSLKDWATEKNKILKNISETFKKDSLVVRSSCAFEDQEGQSMAGQFESLLDIKNDNQSVTEAIEEVIKSYGDVQVPEDHLVLVQPFTANVKMSGVIFSCDLQYGAPYLVINYETTGGTDGVTSGHGDNTKIAYVYRNQKLETISNSLIRQVVDGFKEVEEKIGQNTLDCEFAITQEGELVIFQVRPLTVTDSLIRYYQYDIEKSLENIEQEIIESQKNITLSCGEKTIYSDMSDWNPIEIIGSHPKPLAKSLYQYIITDKAWSVARARIGYKDIGPQKLMKVIGGHPYIDTRLSFNSMLPQGIDNKLEEKLINLFIEKLSNNPHLYDKVEFEVLITCFSPATRQRVEELDSLNDLEKNDFITSLKKLTVEILKGKNLYNISTIKQELEKLSQIRKEINKSSINEIKKISLLLDSCIEYGTVNFSILARYGFIASTYLKEFVSLNIIDEKEYQSFFGSIDSVTSDFTKELLSVKNGDLTFSSFLEKWGHLRPGTYDILSPRYDEAPDYYFSSLNDIDGEVQHEVNDFHLSSESKSKINEYLKKEEIDISLNDLLSFMKMATSGREYAKFIFTQCLSDALLLTSRYFEKNKIHVTDVNFLSIFNILELDNIYDKEEELKKLKSLIDSNKEKYNLEKQIITPPMISSVDDLYYIESFACRPNFVTSDIVSGTAMFLDQSKADELEGKIVCIENADPGFDWLFTKNIKGLITKYGGAASHMAIRCAELGIAAAIGCGEEIFRGVTHKSEITLDCENKQIKNKL